MPATFADVTPLPETLSTPPLSANVTPVRTGSRVQPPAPAAASTVHELMACTSLDASAAREKACGKGVRVGGG